MNRILERTSCFKLSPNTGLWRKGSFKRNNVDKMMFSGRIFYSPVCFLRQETRDSILEATGQTGNLLKASGFIDPVSIDFLQRVVGVGITGSEFLYDCTLQVAKSLRVMDDLTEHKQEILVILFSALIFSVIYSRGFRTDQEDKDKMAPENFSEDKELQEEDSIATEKSRFRWSDLQVLSASTTFSNDLRSKCPPLSSQPDFACDFGEPCHVESNFVSDFSPKECDSALEIELQRICVPTSTEPVIAALDFLTGEDLEDTSDQAEILLLIPGSSMGSQERGVSCFAKFATEKGYKAIILNLPGCGNSPVSSQRILTGVDESFIGDCVAFIQSKNPNSNIFAVGWGLGAHLMVKYLGQSKEDKNCGLMAAVAVSNPFCLKEMAINLDRPMYERERREIIKGFQHILMENQMMFAGMNSGFEVTKALETESVMEFDHAITRVCHGFQTVEDYYTSCSSQGVLGNIQVPVLFLQDTNDPLAPAIAIPRTEIESNEKLMLVVGPDLHNGSSSPSNSKETLALPGAAGNLEWEFDLIFQWLTAVKSTFEEFDEKPLDNADFSALTKWTPPSEEDKNNGEDKEPLAPAVDSPKSEEEKASGEDQSVSQGLQTGQKTSDAEGILNLLAATTLLSPEQKQQVLKGVSEGESLASALESAVPENVRGTMLTSLNEVLKSKNVRIHLGGNPQTNPQPSPEPSQPATTKPPTPSMNSPPSSPSAASTLPTNPHPTPPHTTPTPPSSPPSSPPSPSPSPSSPTQSNSSDESLNENDLSKVSFETPTLEKKPSQDDGEKHDESDETGEGTQREGKKQSGNPEVGIETRLKTVVSPNVGSDEKKVVQQAKDGPITEIKKIEEKSREVGEQQNENETVSRAENEGKLVVDKGVEEASRRQDERENLEEKIKNPGPVSTPEHTDVQLKDKVGEASKIDSVESRPQPQAPETSQNSENELPQQNQSQGLPPNHQSQNPSTSQKAEVENQETDEHKNPVNKAQIVVGENASPTEPQVPPQKPADTPEGGEESMAPNSSQGQVSSPSVPPKTAGEKKMAQFDVKAAVEAFTELDDSTQLAVTNVFGVVASVLCKLEEEQVLREKEGQNLEGDPQKDTDLVGNSRAEDNRTVQEKKETPEAFLGVKSGEVKGDTRDDSATITKGEGEGGTDGEHLRGEREKKEENTIFQNIERPVTNAIKLRAIQEIGAAGFKAVGMDVEGELVKATMAVANAVGGGNVREERGKKRHSDEVEGPESGNCDDSERSSSGSHGFHSRGFNSVAVMQAVGAALGGTSFLGTLLPIGTLFGVVVAAVAAIVIAIKNDMEDDEGGNFGKTKFEGETGQEQVDLGENSIGGEGNLVVSEKENREGESENVGEEGERYASGGMGGSLDDLAERALSVAGNVIPKGQDGSVDHDRLVATLSGLGQKGGFLRLITKGALLWSGIRGAISVVDRLIKFLRIETKPLLYRLVLFLLMGLLLWIPVLVPLLPSLLQQMATGSPAGIVTQTALAIGLYCALFLLVKIWGERVRGYQKPLRTYGLRLLSRDKLPFLIRGTLAGMATVFLLYSLQCALKYATFSLPMPQFGSEPLLTSLARLAFGLLKAVKLLLEALLVGLTVSLVEEVLFRAWLLEEAAVDLGFHRAALLSALLFALVHRPPAAIPGLVLLSLSLTGMRDKSQGLALPIGFHAGLVAANFMVTVSESIRYTSGHPVWLTGAHLHHPLAGALAVGILSIVTLLSYPWGRSSGRVEAAGHSHSLMLLLPEHTSATEVVMGKRLGGDEGK